MVASGSTQPRPRFYISSMLSVLLLSRVIEFRNRLSLEAYRKLWRPRRDLNPCYRRESGMAKP